MRSALVVLGMRVEVALRGRGGHPMASPVRFRLLGSFAAVPRPE